MLRIGLSGDVSFSGGFSAAHSRNFSDLFSPAIIRFLQVNDFNVMNIEGPLVRPGETGIYKNDPLFSPAESYIHLKGLGCNVFNMANNHITDCGIDGLYNTIELARRNGAGTVGAGQNIAQAAAPLVLEHTGVRVGLVSLSHREGMVAGSTQPGVFSDTKTAAVKAAIEAARKVSDWVLVVYHGGEEFTHIPMPSRRRKLRRFLDFGADIVVAHHPHVVQGYEQLGEKTIFYSLGNFVFDLPAHHRYPGTTDSVLLRLSFTKERYHIESLFTRIDRKRFCVTNVETSQHFVGLDPRTFIGCWNQEAFRILSSASQSDSSTPSAVRGNQVLRLLTNPKVYRAVIKGLLQPNRRPLILGATCHLIGKALGRRNLSP